MQYSLENLKGVAEFLSQECANHTIWIFDGEMGAGKTTLIKGLCDFWLVKDAVSSPTFSIVNEYATDNEETLYHFDFYRINDEVEAEDIGVDTYFYSGDKCLIEWASKIPNLIPDNYVVIEIVIVDDSTRMIEIRENGE